MSKKSMKPVSLAVGTAFVASIAAGNAAADAEVNTNPFAMNELSSGYMQLAYAGSGDKSEKEGKCGGDKSDKEGKCGGDKEGKYDKGKDDKEGKCGEGKCGGDMKEKEGGGGY